MPKLKIEGIPAYNGSYDLDVAGFTGRELHTIKEISGVRANELQDAFVAGDYDLVVAFTVITLRRAGKIVNPDEIMDAEVGSITIDVDDDVVGEDEERPPASSPTPNGDENSSGVGASANEPTQSSGSPSSDGGDDLPSPLRAIGSLS